jgi:integrase
MQAMGQAPPNRGRTFPAEVLTEADVQAILRQCSQRAPTGVRNRALIVTMHQAVLRISEALALRMADAGPVAACVDEESAAVLQRWIETRRQRGIPGDVLFCTLKGGPVSDRYVRDMLKRKAAKAGLDKRVHPHGLRAAQAGDRSRADRDAIRLLAVKVRAQVRDQGGARTYTQAHLVARLHLGLLDRAPVACRGCGKPGWPLNAALNWPEVPAERLRADYRDSIFSVAPESDYIPLCNGCHRRVDSWRAALPKGIVVI